MAKRHFIFIALTLLIWTNSYSQTERVLSRDSSWRSNGVFALNIGQTSFTNWASGGEDQINLNTILHYRLRYNKDKSSWENMIEAKYGTLLFLDKSPKKTDDKISFTSKYGHKAGTKWNYSYYLSFNSQFTEGYNYPNDSVVISNFMAPAYIMAGLGMDYLPNKTLSVLISPITYKLTIVNDDNLANEGSFGVEEAVRDSSGNIIQTGKRFFNEPGAFLKIYYQEEFKKGLNVSSKIEFFSAFQNNPENIDIIWSTFISYRISKLFSATFSLDVIYDDDVNIVVDNTEVGPKPQAKQTFGIGISIRL